MDIPILLEPANGTGFRATTFVPLHLVAEGTTRDEALDHLRTLVESRLAGAEIATLQVPLSSDNPLLKLAGTWRNHPDADEFEHNIREYRRQVDEDPHRP
jgi:hypothetical protein